MNPQFPLYIVSKGRADTRFTSKALEEMRVPYSIVVEEQEYNSYAAVIDKKKILVLDKKYQAEYDTCDDLGDTKSKGPGAARNFAWEHSISLGASWHWVMDDNIRDFRVLQHNARIKAGDGALFALMEYFVLRYQNIDMAGPNYTMFVPDNIRQPPFILNTRIYSCNLIRNSLPFRWRGRYNEDTDLSLRILKSGRCTVQFNTYLQKKIETQAVKGGNTAEFYKEEGTLPKSKMQVALHPDVSRLVFKFKRWHHHVDYSGFTQRLIRNHDATIPEIKLNLIDAPLTPLPFKTKGAGNEPQ